MTKPAVRVRLRTKAKPPSVPRVRATSSKRVALWVGGLLLFVGVSYLIRFAIWCSVMLDYAIVGQVACNQPVPPTFFAPCESLDCYQASGTPLQLWYVPIDEACAIIPGHHHAPIILYSPFFEDLPDAAAADKPTQS